MRTMKMKMTATALLATGLVLAGCTIETGGSDTEPALSEQEVAEYAMDVTWDDMSSSEQQRICMGWSLFRDDMIDAYIKGLYSEGDPGISERVAIEALEDKLAEEC